MIEKYSAVNQQYSCLYKGESTQLCIDGTIQELDTQVKDIIVNPEGKYSQKLYYSNFIPYKCFQDFFNTEIVHKYLNNITKYFDHSIQGADNKEDFLNQHSPQQVELFQKLSQQLENLNNTTIVAIPVFAGEENLGELIEVLSTNIRSDVPIVLYINASQDFGVVDFKEKLEWIKRQVHNKTNIKIISHQYKNRETIASIRADMIGAILTSAQNIEDSIVIGLDADTYRLSPDYIQKVEEYFEQSLNAHRGASHLKWSDKEKHPVAWLSEYLMQLGCKGGVMNASRDNSPHAFGAITSFRLKSYTKIGGYHRGLKKFEDLYLGMQLNTLGNNNDNNSFIDTFAQVHPRRGIQAIEDGATFGDQWNGDFMPVNDKEKCGELLSNITKTLMNGGLLDTPDMQLITQFINKHFKFEIAHDASKLAFIKYWNSNMKNSAYAVKKKGSRVVFIPKGDIIKK